MAINAKNDSKPRELIPAGNYIARCYKMIEIGNVETQYMGAMKVMPKVRIGWELPHELKVFKEENGPQPLVIEKEYTLSTAETANLRKMLAGWRGKDFTEEEAKVFDITNVVGAACMLNIIHKASKTDASKIYEQISGVTPMPKGIPCPPQINKNWVLSYDNWDEQMFDSLPDFIKDKMKTSMEYAAMKSPAQDQLTSDTEEDLHNRQSEEDEENSLPF